MTRRIWESDLKEVPKGATWIRLKNQGHYRIPKLTEENAYIDGALDKWVCNNMPVVYYSAVLSLDHHWIAKQKVGEWMRDKDDQLVWKEKQLVGSFPKRLAAYLKWTKAEGITSAAIAQIGERAKRFILEYDETFAFDITSDLHSWTAGDFGDEGSCFWGERENARASMEDANAVAFRLWKRYAGWEDDDPSTHKYLSEARMWMIPHEYGLLCFNAYSNGWGRDLERLCLLASSVLGLKTFPIRLNNHGTRDGLIYINSYENIILANKEPPESSFDLDLDDSSYYEDHCINCGQGITEGYIYYSPEDESLCESCFDEACTSCHSCGASIWQEDSTVYNGSDYCPSCANFYLTSCDECDKTILQSDATDVDDGNKTMCEECTIDIAHWCEDCGEWYTEEYTEEHNHSENEEDEDEEESEKEGHRGISK